MPPRPQIMPPVAISAPKLDINTLKGDILVPFMAKIRACSDKTAWHSEAIEALIYAFAEDVVKAHPYLKIEEVVKLYRVSYKHSANGYLFLVPLAFKSIHVNKGGLVAVAAVTKNGTAVQYTLNPEAYSGSMITAAKTSYEEMNSLKIKGTTTATDKLEDVESAVSAKLTLANMMLQGPLRQATGSLGNPISPITFYGEWALVDPTNGIDCTLLHRITPLVATSGNPFTIELHEDIATGYKLCPVCFVKGYRCLHGKAKEGGKRIRTKEDKEHDRAQMFKRLAAAKADAAM